MDSAREAGGRPRLLRFELATMVAGAGSGSQPVIGLVNYLHD